MKPERPAETPDPVHLHEPDDLWNPADFQDPGGSRKAVIDIGTNSVRLLVADVAGDGTFQTVFQGLHMPRLGQGVDRTGRLHPTAMERTVAAVGDLRARADASGAESIVVVGTSALRDAANRRQFIDRVRRDHGVEVKVLSGEEEAAASFFGAVRGVFSIQEVPGEAGVPREGSAGGKGDVYVLDVGGGSTELTSGTRDGEMLVRVSADVGAVRMTEACIASDPPSDRDWRRLSDAVDRGLQPLWTLHPDKNRGGVRRVAHGASDADASFLEVNPPTLIAVGGTATTLAAIDIGLPEYDSRRVHGHRLSAASVRRLLTKMRSSTAAERLRLPAMQPERVDIIVAGTFIVERVLRDLGLEQLIVSEADLLVGVLLSRPH